MLDSGRSCTAPSLKNGVSCSDVISKPSVNWAEARPVADALVVGSVDAITGTGVVIESAGADGVKDKAGSATGGGSENSFGSGGTGHGSDSRAAGAGSSTAAGIGRFWRIGFRLGNRRRLGRQWHGCHRIDRHGLGDDRFRLGLGGRFARDGLVLRLGLLRNGLRHGRFLDLRWLRFFFGARLFHLRRFRFLLGLGLLGL